VTGGKENIKKRKKPEINNDSLSILFFFRKYSKIARKKTKSIIDEGRIKSPSVFFIKKDREIFIFMKSFFL
jgi:hypothetical protein